MIQLTRIASVFVLLGLFACTGTEGHASKSESQQAYEANVGAFRHLENGDVEKAIALSKRAMDLGSKWSAVRYASILESRGAPRDVVGPIYESASTSSHPCVAGIALFRLGLLYFSDDPEKAQVYLLQAAEQGDPEAMNTYLTLAMKHRATASSERVRSMAEALVRWEPEVYGFLREKIVMEPVRRTSADNRWYLALESGCGAVMRDTEEIEQVFSRY